jgi:hypothetical protein
MIDPTLILLGLVFAGTAAFTALAIFMYTRRQIMKRWQHYKFNRNRLRAMPRAGAKVVKLGIDELAKVGDYQTYRRTPRYIRVPPKHQS